MSTTTITPQTFKQEGIQVPFITRVKDLFARDLEEHRIEWTAPDYYRVSILWGLFEFESGERRSFIVKGPPGFCEKVIEHLYTKGQIESHS